MRETKSDRRYVVTLAAMAAIYFAAAKFGLSFAQVAPQVTAVWPPTGIALAVMLLFGYSLWPGIAVGAFVANASTQETYLTAAVIAVGNTLEALAGAYLLRRMVAFQSALERIRDVIALAICGAVVSTTISATVGASSLCLFNGENSVPWSHFGQVWRVWWTGDAMGALLVAPLLLTWAVRLRSSRPLHRQAETAALFVSLAAVSYTILIGTHAHVSHSHYLVFPFFIWAALRLGQAVTATSIVLVASMAVWGEAHAGAFSGQNAHEQLMQLQVYMGVFSLTALSLGAAIAERKRAEAELERKTQELARSNADLEEFSSIVSHDLRSPLVSLMGCMDLLTGQGSIAKDPEAAELMGLVRDSARHMADRIRILLEHSRMGFRDLRLTPCRFETILDQVLSDLSASIGKSGAQVTRDALPTVMVDEKLFQEVLQNLIENGIKYQDKPDPQVHVSAQPNGREWIFRVRDNGIGIDPRHRTRLFGLFEKLDPRTEGTGMGLALAQRVVEVHGGKIWVESDGPGKGATFRFTLAKTKLKST